VVVDGAGRTDAGVHACGQVASAAVSITHDVATLKRALNAQLPEDVRVLDVEDAPPGFHARFSARAKTYEYRIRNAPVGDPFRRAYEWFVPEPLDVEAMREAAQCLVGTHDFAAFQSTGGDGSGSIRTMIRSQWRQTPGRLTYEIAGDGFLRHMVRAVVGTLVEVGRRRRPVGSMAALVAGGSRSQAGATAPPHGLFLISVDYHERVVSEGLNRVTG
jgi:tRNA pseudouridine38-40 synthase